MMHFKFEKLIIW